MSFEVKDLNGDACQQVYSWVTGISDAEKLDAADEGKTLEGFQ
jgi:hypothetical protein